MIERELQNGKGLCCALHFVEESRRGQMKEAKRSDWRSEDLPAKRTAVALDRSFSPAEMQRIYLGLVPAQMEDKWFVFWEEGTLFFHRSWTGFCIYAVHFTNEGGSWRMTSAEVNRDPTQYGGVSDDRDVEMVSYLVDVLLLHKEALFPSDEPSLEKRALANWSQIGRAMLGQHTNGDE